MLGYHAVLSENLTGFVTVHSVIYNVSTTSLGHHGLAFRILPVKPGYVMVTEITTVV